ncbi:hypothetical protein PARPLA_02805 [Rhodobacteraceae bacterium THAF1]|uniref:hypothetical protein n=1 Tax=Palleronia sp. THAF1 TaxID=2587842 RepID=UPI000F3ACE5C|nr:hypothetical protein [Palleronia sp. THAF1]QFU08208.1 hypothetical protein FIU81_05935 [Palleronia sp. THAF1]VDC28762.1 hypothetical protein PARPLA_02805 [Rhodobacteraceae bacterium THAF1]
MQDINTLQDRLDAALTRIGRGLSDLGPLQTEPEVPPQPEGPDPAELEAELASEREVTAQLQERLKTSRERADARIAEVESDLQTAQDQLAEIEADRVRLKAMLTALRDTCEALRTANEEGLGDSDLINTAMATEIEALHAMRASDRAELEAIVAMIGDATDEGGR